MNRISVFIPAYNEAESLPLVLNGINNFFVKNNKSGEVVVVNDGSTDNTKVVLANLEKKYNFLRVVHHTRNLGLTKAFMSFFKASKGDIYVFLPADFESDPEQDIPKLLGKMNEGYDLVCGRRVNRVGGKKLASGVYNFLSRLLFNIQIHDFNWIKAFKKEVVEGIHLRSDWHRYIPMLAKARGFSIGEVDVKTIPRPFGKSKFGKKRLLIGLFDLFVVKFHFSFLERPMLLFGSLGAILMSIGFLGGVYLLAIKILTGVIGDRIPLLFLVVLMILSGIQLFALGLIAEYITTIREEKD
jgi:glycosyltransferase involved in cell wall biosynthesis